MNKIPYDHRREIYADAIDKWGVETQCIVAIEEMSEVIKSITKWMRLPFPEEENAIPSIIEEIADATIMLEQLRMIFDINNAVCEAMDAKVMRLKRRVEE